MKKIIGLLVMGASIFFKNFLTKNGIYIDPLEFEIMFWAGFVVFWLK